MNSYNVEIRKDKTFLERFVVEAPDRRKAVHKAQLYFWYKYHGRIGFVNQCMTVTDPYGEVKYTSNFSCHDKLNRLLPEDIVERIILESKGELERDLRTGRAHFPPGSVKRVKRRRDFGKFIAPNIRQMKNGKLYYRIITRTQTSKNGRVFQKRKYRDIPLFVKSRSLAVFEIKERELAQLNAFPEKRRVFFRDNSLLKWVCGLGEKPTNIPKGFKKVLNHYTSLAKAS